MGISPTTPTQQITDVKSSQKSSLDEAVTNPPFYSALNLHVAAHELILNRHIKNDNSLSHKSRYESHLLLFCYMISSSFVVHITLVTHMLHYCRICLMLRSEVVRRFMVESILVSFRMILHSMCSSKRYLLNENYRGCIFVSCLHPFMLSQCGVDFFNFSLYFDNSVKNSMKQAR